MKIPRLFIRSSAALAAVLLPSCIGQTGQTDAVKVRPIEIKDIDAKLDTIYGQNRQILHILNTNDTPIKVRGGAMTFVTDTWWPIGSKAAPSTGAYCTTIDESTIRLTDFKGAPYNTVTALDGTAAWSVILFRSNPDGTADFHHGVLINHEPKGKCSGGKNIHVEIKPLKAGDDQFYPIPEYPAHSGNEMALPSKRHFRRYMDSTCNNRNDRDLCERMAAIQIVTSKGSESYTCDELDCTVVLGAKLLQ